MTFHIIKIPKLKLVATTKSSNASRYTSETPQHKALKEQFRVKAITSGFSLLSNPVLSS